MSGTWISTRVLATEWPSCFVRRCVVLLHSIVWVFCSRFTLQTHSYWYRPTNRAQSHCVLIKSKCKTDNPALVARQVGTEAVVTTTGSKCILGTVCQWCTAQEYQMQTFCSVWQFFLLEALQARSSGFSHTWTLDVWSLNTSFRNQRGRHWYSYFELSL